MLSWLSIVRLGLVQMALGAIVVLTTSTLNRVMVVELALPAVLPGFLVALHYGIQITRPNWGFKSDTGGNRTRWIVLGMLALGCGAVLAGAAIPVFPSSFAAGLAISIMAYAMIGLGVGAGGTSLLALLATYTDPRRRAAAATITWLMMIAGIAVTASLVGANLEPYSPARLIMIAAIVAAIAFVTTCLAVLGIERRLGIINVDRNRARQSFREGFREIWGERSARLFTLFVFLSMTAYFMQELILEPYAGLVFGFSPGQSTSLSGAQNGGVFIGMVVVGLFCSGLKIGSLRQWVIGGCLLSALTLLLIIALGQIALPMSLTAAVILMGFANGVFAVAAIGSMMQLASDGRSAREGTRMGLWGAAQAIAAGFGGLVGAAAVDVMRHLTANTADAFAAVFLVEALLFAASALFAFKILKHGTLPVRSGVATVPNDPLKANLVAGE